MNFSPLNNKGAKISKIDHWFILGKARKISAIYKAFSWILHSKARNSFGELINSCINITGKGLENLSKGLKRLISLKNLSINLSGYELFLNQKNDFVSKDISNDEYRVGLFKWRIIKIDWFKKSSDHSYIVNFKGEIEIFLIDNSCSGISDQGIESLANCLNKLSSLEELGLIFMKYFIERETVIYDKGALKWQIEDLLVLAKAWNQWKPWRK